MATVSFVDGYGYGTTWDLAWSTHTVDPHALLSGEQSGDLCFVAWHTDQVSEFLVGPVSGWSSISTNTGITRNVLQVWWRYLDGTLADVWEGTFQNGYDFTFWVGAFRDAEVFHSQADHFVGGSGSSVPLPAGRSIALQFFADPSNFTAPAATGPVVRDYYSDQIQWEANLGAYYEPLRSTAGGPFVGSISIGAGGETHLMDVAPDWGSEHMRAVFVLR